MTCSLFTAEIIHADGFAIPELSEVVEYEAISYSWGTLSTQQPLICNGLQYAASPNLSTALHYLRHTNTPRYLWCDALCINQNDDREKTVQIRNVFDIFAKARRVVAWLGEETEWTSVAFEVLRKTTADPLVTFQFQTGPFERWSILPDISYGDRRTIVQEALADLYRRPWCKRTWVRQEVFAAQHVVVRCGAHEIEYYSLFGYLNYILSSGSTHEIDRPLKADLRRFYKVLDIQCRGASKGSTASEMLVQTLANGELFDISDPRDFVYGILGLIRNISSPSQHLAFRNAYLKVPSFPRGNMAIKSDILTFPINCAKIVSDVFQDVAKFSIKKDKSLQVLHSFEVQSGRAPDIPSWSIDWRSLVKENSLKVEEERDSLDQPT